jgi:formylmethanofuran dehydrogenase subunit D
VLQYYGKKGDKIKIIAEHGEVLIVEDTKGRRFSVNKEKVI